MPVCFCGLEEGPAAAAASAANAVASSSRGNWDWSQHTTCQDLPALAHVDLAFYAALCYVLTAVGHQRCCKQWCQPLCHRVSCTLWQLPGVPGNSGHALRGVVW